MPEYTFKPDIWKACLWKNHGCDFDIDVEITKKQGITGYGAKLGYYNDHNKRMQTIRPGDYLLISPDGKITTMIASEFESKYTLAKNTKPVNNGFSSGLGDKLDNVEERPIKRRGRPKVADNR